MIAYATKNILKYGCVESSENIQKVSLNEKVSKMFLQHISVSRVMFIIQVYIFIITRYLMHV